MSISLDETIIATKIVAIMRGVTAKNAEKTAEALFTGGIKAIEITLTTDDAVEAIRLVSRAFGEAAVIGAGTVLTCEEVERVCDAGARFVVAPNTDVEVISCAKRLGISAIPGALTPTEIVTAVQAGADYVKLFPAGNMGLGYFKSLRGPFPNIPFVVTGGIGLENLADFLSAGAYGAGIGGNLVSVKKIEEGDFNYITEAARQYADVVNALGKLGSE